MTSQICFIDALLLFSGKKRKAENRHRLERMFAKHAGMTNTHTITSEADSNSKASLHAQFYGPT